MPKPQQGPKRRAYRITYLEFGSHKCQVMVPLTDRGASDMAKTGWLLESVA